MDDACRQFDAEASLLASVDHPHILALHGVSLGPPSLLCLVLELAQCSLWDVLHAQDTEALGAAAGAAADEPGSPQQEQQREPQLTEMTLQRQLSLAREAATAVEFLHAQVSPPQRILRILI